MTVPHPENPAADPAFPDVVDDIAPERGSVPDPQEPALPGDQYMGALQVGTTVQEQIDGESLQRKLTREVPDELTDPADDEPRAVDELSDDVDAEQPAGRLVEPDQGASTDVEPDAVGTAYLQGETDASPEEQAMHVREV